MTKNNEMEKKRIIAGIDENKKDAIWAIDVAQIPGHIKFEDALEEWRKGNIPNSAVRRIYPDIPTDGLS